MRLSIILGYITAISLIVVLWKYIARISGNRNMDALFWKWHKPASGVFFLAVLIHLFITIPRWSEGRVLLPVFGLAACLVSVILTACCHGMKEPKKKMHWHRVYSVLLLVLAVGHVIVFWI